VSWIIVPDAVYAQLEVEARRESVTVDAYAERVLRQAHVSIPIDGKPFKVYRASDLDKLPQDPPS